MTGIQWTNETWNPIRGCSRVSAGCQHCYAEKQAMRMSGGYALTKEDDICADWRAKTR